LWRLLHQQSGLDYLFPFLADLSVLDRGNTFLNSLNQFLLVSSLSNTKRFLNYIVTERIFDKGRQPITEGQFGDVVGSSFIWCEFQASFKHIRRVLLDTKLWDVASKWLKNRLTYWLGPPCDDFRDSVVAKRVTSNLDYLLSYLTHNVLLLILSGCAGDDYLYHA
jgi:hypothetical protein